MLEQEELEKLAGVISKISYELHDKEFISEDFKETLLEFWREFSHYEDSINR